MKCIAPILAKGSTAREPVWVPCGRCGFCLANRKMDWTFRMLDEYRSAYWTDFVTLTYNEESLPEIADSDGVAVPTLNPVHLKNFLKRLRKQNAKHTRLALRFYACGEYGTKGGRPHYHLCVFNMHPKTKYKHLEKCWSDPKSKRSYGFVEAESALNPGSVMDYVASYCITAYEDDKNRVNHRPFARMSLRPALGAGYVRRNREYHKALQEPFLRRGEKVQRLPRYIKEKMFEKYERNAWKQTALEQAEMKLAAEIHRLRLLNGPKWPAFTYLEKQKIYHEQFIKSHAKKNDRY